MSSDIYIVALSWEWFINHCRHREETESSSCAKCGTAFHATVLCKRGDGKGYCTRGNCKMVRFQLPFWQFEKPGEFYEYVRESLDVVPDWLEEQRGDSSDE